MPPPNWIHSAEPGQGLGSTPTRFTFTRFIFEVIDVDFVLSYESCMYFLNTGVAKFIFPGRSLFGHPHSRCNFKLQQDSFVCYWVGVTTDDSCDRASLQYMSCLSLPHFWQTCLSSQQIKGLCWDAGVAAMTGICHTKSPLMGTWCHHEGDRTVIYYFANFWTTVKTQKPS